jgi:hypothetical protein
LLSVAGAFCLILGVASVGRWRIPLGGLGQVSGHARQLRLELGDHDADPFQYRPHYASVHVFARARPLGPVAEIGMIPLTVAATVFFGVSTWLMLPRRVAPGVCPHCRYALAGLPAGAASCPECGGALGAPATPSPAAATTDAR